MYSINSMIKNDVFSSSCLHQKSLSHCIIVKIDKIISIDSLEHDEYQAAQNELVYLRFKPLKTGCYEFQQISISYYYQMRGLLGGPLNISGIGLSEHPMFYFFPLSSLRGSYLFSKEESYLEIRLFPIK